MSRVSASPGVVIAGAGIAGLALAAGLSGSGLGVTVLEASDSRRARDGGAGLVLFANALRTLEALGIDWESLPGSRRIGAVALRDRDGRCLARSRLPGGVALGLRRSTLIAALAANLDTDIRFGDRIAAVHEHADTLAIRSERGWIARASLLIGADGLRSSVRALIDERATPRFRGYVEYRGVLERVAGNPYDGEIAELHGRGVRMGVFAVGDDALGWWVTLNEPRDAVPSDAMRLLHARTKDFPACCREILERQDPSTLLRTPILDLPPLRAFGRGRVVLVGDAAHAATPDLGQGAAMALEDAAILGGLLRRSDDLCALRARYERSRLPRTHRVQRLAGALGRTGQWTGWLAGARCATLRVLPASMLFASVFALQRYDPAVEHDR